MKNIWLSKIQVESEIFSIIHSNSLPLNFLRILTCGSEQLTFEPLRFYSFSQNLARISIFIIVFMKYSFECEHLMSFSHKSEYKWWLLSFRVKTAKGIHRPRLLVAGDDIAHSQGPRLAQALLYRMEHVPVQTLDVSTLFAESARSPEETCVQVSCTKYEFLDFSHENSRLCPCDPYQSINGEFFINWIRFFFHRKVFT